MFLHSSFLLFPVLLQSSCFSLMISCFHTGPLFPTLSVLLLCLELFQVPAGDCLRWTLRSEPPPDPLHYPCTHGTRPPVTSASCPTWCLAEACNGRECRQRRKPRQPGEQKSYARWALGDSLLILEGLPSSRRAMALPEDALCCARDRVRSLFLGVTWVRWNWRGFRCKCVLHFSVLVSAITKSLSKLILMKWTFVNVEITLIKIVGKGKASERVSQLCEWTLPPCSLANFISRPRQFGS